ncbi:alpha/beta fold hydrolase [Streptomyces massasporeus]|uniref:alpha/beta fold hydrolase n=1 Tax=Streptomyces massasporeus TaxID=67324 RepID=UPI0036FFBFDF
MMDGTSRLLPLLDAVHDTAAEVRARFPDYFLRRPLRLSTDTLRRSGVVAADPVLRLIGDTYGLTLVPADGATLTAVDRLVEQRAPAPARIRPVDGVDDQDLAGWLIAVRRRQEQDRRRAEEDARRWAAASLRRVAVRGGVVSYLAAGEREPGREPVVILNALGMRLGPWHPLIATLARRHRVLAWEPRRTTTHEQYVLLDDHARDLEAVLKDEGATSCHVLAWCSGLKVAMQFHRHRPHGVRSLVLLNGSLKVLGRQEEPDTTYERNLENLCRALVDRPSSASAVVRVLTGQTVADMDPTTELDPHRFAEHVLALPSRDLEHEIRRPFASESDLIVYAHQLLDFWSVDVLGHASSVHAPVLCLTSEFDRIVSPERMESAAARFPDARLTRIPGASHYVMYDRPEELSVVLEKFIDESSRPTI